MAKKKKEKMGFAYNFILGLFIISALLGIFFMVVLFDLKSILFYFFLSWTIIYSFLVYCWLDADRWSLVEKVTMPLMEDAGVLIWILVPVVGIIFSIYNLVNKIDVSNYIIVLIMLSIFLAGDILLIKKDIFTLNIIKYIRSRRNK